MKICFIHNRWGQTARGGAERVLENLIAYLLRSGQEIIVITISASASVRVENPEPSLTIYYVPSSFLALENWSYIRRFFWHLSQAVSSTQFKQLKEIIRNEKPELVVTENLTGFGLKSLSIARSRAFKHVHILHDIQYLHPSGLLLWNQERLLKTPAAKIYQRIVRHYLLPQTIIISPSRWLLALYRHQGFFKQQPAVVLPNPFFQSKRLEVRKTPTNDQLTFLFVGQIEKHKGIIELISAFKRCPQPTWRLVVMGEGSLLSHLKNETFDTRITFTGQQSKTAVNMNMESADCLIVPSWCYENYPTVILEAMSCGLPVIGSAFGGTKEMLVQPELLCEPTIEGLKNKLEWAGNNYAELVEISRQQYSAEPKLSIETYWRDLLFLIK